MNTIERMLAYMYHTLNEQTRNLFEISIEHDEEFAEMYDNLLGYCISNKLTTREKFDEKWNDIIKKRDGFVEGYEKFENHVKTVIQQIEKTHKPYPEYLKGPVEFAVTRDGAIITDNELVEKYRTGDNNAAEELIKRNEAELSAIGRRRFIDYPELVYDVFIDVYETLAKVPIALRPTKFLNNEGIIDVQQFLVAEFENRTEDEWLNWKYCNGDNRALGILIKKYWQEVFFKTNKGHKWNRDLFVEFMGNVFIKLCEKEDREWVFKQENGNIVVPQTLCSRIIYKSKDNYRDLQR